MNEEDSFIIESTSRVVYAISTKISCVGPKNKRSYLFFGEIFDITHSGPKKLNHSIRTKHSKNHAAVERTT